MALEDCIENPKPETAAEAKKWLGNITASIQVTRMILASPEHFPDARHAKLTDQRVFKVGLARLGADKLTNAVFYTLVSHLSAPRGLTS